MFVRGIDRGALPPSDNFIRKGIEMIRRTGWPWPLAWRHDLAPMVELALSMFAIAGAPSAFGAELKVPRWQPQDFSFKSEDAQATPFLVDFAATVTRPGGGSFKSPGFFDGDGVWKIRVAPDAEGAWSIETHSSDPSLNGKKASFECVANGNPNVHGGLRIDPKHPTHFIFEDGTRYFLMGYECDWLWALDTGKDDLPTLDPFLDNLAAFGFNQILLEFQKISMRVSRKWKAQGCRSVFLLLP